MDHGRHSQKDSEIGAEKSREIRVLAIELKALYITERKITESKVSSLPHFFVLQYGFAAESIVIWHIALRNRFLSAFRLRTKIRKSRLLMNTRKLYCREKSEQLTSFLRFSRTDSPNMVIWAHYTEKSILCASLSTKMEKAERNH